MIKRAGRAGQWVLPAAAIFLALTALWAIATFIAAMAGDRAGGAGGLLRGLSLAAGLLALVAASATLAGIAYLLVALFQLRSQPRETNAPIEQLLRRQNQLIEALSEASLVSDRAKAIAFREKEREALRKAIREDISKQDWEAAYYLISEMERSFGYRQEAQRLRTEIDRQRDEAVRATMAGELARFRQLLAQREWDAAFNEARVLATRHPGRVSVRDLDDEIEEARGAHKRRLLSDLKQCIDRSDLDRGIALLRELDQYLTPGEAEGLREAARGVFRAKLHNLGVQFSMAVSEQNWNHALEVGQEIIDEFPNSRFAQEVRDTTEVLRRRAAGPAGEQTPAATG